MSTTNPATQTAENPATTAAAAENPAVAEAASAPLPPEPAALDAAAARVEVKPPEEALLPDNTAILPAPTIELPKPPQSVAPAPEHSSPAQAAGGLIIMPAVLAEAEKHLAASIGQAISPQLEPGLLLSLQSLPDKGATNLVLAFTGEMVAANASLLGEEVVAALRHMPQMKDLLAHQHTPQVHLHEGKLEVTIPHLSTAQYAHLIQAFAAGITPTHACTGAGCPGCAATKDAAPTADAPAGAMPDTAQQPAPAIAEVAATPAIAAEVLQPPVAAAPAVAAETATSPLVEQPAAVPNTLVAAPAANRETLHEQPAKAAGVAA